MSDDALEGPGIEGVLFDFHATLIDQGSGVEWLQAAWRHAERESDPAASLGPAAAAELAVALDRIWDTAREIDPGNSRDLDPVAHRSVFNAAVGRLGTIDSELATALYDTFQLPWLVNQQTIPVLQELRRRGIRTVLVSNVGVDIRHVLDRTELSDLFDAVVLSYEAGSVKPDSAIFAEALRRIDVPAERALMVGDSWRDDAGAARIGIRTLILPPQTGVKNDLVWVLRLVGALEP